MKPGLKCPPLEGGRNLLIILTTIGIFFGISLPGTLKAPLAEADLVEISNQKDLGELALIEGNSFLPISDSRNPEPQPIQRIKVIVTGYSSTPWETDDNPYLTAAGTWVRDGIVANNIYSFGTKVKFPEIFGDKIFVVEDRMSWEKDNYHFDIWFSSYEEAKNFGAKWTYAEILNN
jgi:3D (Asp-Asp-Asp) domain-containing protein